MGTGKVSRRLIALALVGVAASVAACGGSPKPSHTPKPTHIAAPTPSPPPGFTDKYGSLHSGMALADVRLLMGGDGSTLSESDNGAGTTSKVIEWTDPKTSKSIIVSFVNDLETTKSAVGF
ncbi:MAG: hypothetical protein ACREN2_06045 [Candidatus Dormibacteria bacterium]